MDEVTVKEMLNQLAEIQAQLDLIGIEENKLLSSVQVPEEVQAIHTEGEERKKKLREQSSSILSALDQEMNERLSQITIPEEVQEILLNIDRQREAVRAEIEQRKHAVQTDLLTRIEKVDHEFGKQVEKVYREVETRKQEISLEFGEKRDAAAKNETSLIEKIKAGVKLLKKTVKGAYNQAVYTKGRTTWKTDALEDVYTNLLTIITRILQVQKKEELKAIADSLQQEINALALARKEGEPSVAIRRS